METLALQPSIGITLQPSIGITLQRSIGITLQRSIGITVPTRIATPRCTAPVETPTMVTTAIMA